MEKEKAIKDLKDTKEKLKNFVPKECEIYSRVVGYYRPIKQWNPGKQEEWKDRVTYENLD